jgi:hypothetical protein
VVGINSFNGKNGNNTQHVVFQFQNVLVKRRMKSGYNNSGGYPASEMYTYLTGNFFTGLKAAGVPESVLWGPSRSVDNKTVTDRLWLPSEREMGLAYRSVDPGENLVQLEYYKDDTYRIKYDKTGVVPYWGSSASTGNTTDFCYVTTSGAAAISYAGAAYGVAPAFCVK